MKCVVRSKTSSGNIKVALFFQGSCAALKNLSGCLQVNVCMYRCLLFQWSQESPIYTDSKRQTSVKQGELTLRVELFYMLTCFIKDPFLQICTDQTFICWIYILEYIYSSNIPLLRDIFVASILNINNITWNHYCNCPYPLPPLNLSGTVASFYFMKYKATNSSKQDQQKKIVFIYLPYVWSESSGKKKDDFWYFFFKKNISICISIVLFC